ncbi:MAG: type II secretion system F family protein [Patescibacteria group bacterium]|nr:type II secretion system F family protein [Patescibacteria group bacterium]
MPNYNYVVKNIKGKVKSGVFEAEDKSKLAEIFRKDGYVLISATLEDKTSIKNKLDNLFSLFGRVSIVEKLMFTRNLRIMIASGISLPRSLKILIAQAKSKKFKNALSEMEKDIIQGSDFSKALSKHPDIFSNLFQNMVRAGEQGGTLEQSLDVLTNQMERSYHLKSKIKGAMMYPIVIIVAMILIGIVMLILVVPKLAETFDALNIELPLTTKVIIAIGSFLANFWYLLPVIILFIAILLRAIWKTEKGKLLRDFLFLKIPIISSLVKKTNSAYTIRTLSSLIVAGVPIVSALKTVSGTLSNVYYKQAILEASDEVKKGTKLSEALKKHNKIYPNLVIQMISVGEETGETSDILQKLAEFFEEEVERISENLSSLVEPVLMLVVGAAVGFFAISIIQPMYSMIGSM